jgi:hypothetical protein
MARLATALLLPVLGGCFTPRVCGSGEYLIEDWIEVTDG